MSGRARAGRRGRIAGVLWTAAGIALAAYDLLFLVAILYRHPQRFDFTAERENTLSKETLRRLSLLDEDVRVVFPYIFQVGNPQDDLKKQVLARSRLLLDEYFARQPRLRMEAQLNVALESDAQAWKQICEKHDLGPSLVNRFIFLSADGKHRQGVTAEDLAVYDKVTDPREQGQIREFRAQQAFTAAISRLIYREKKRAYCISDRRGPALADKGLGGLAVLQEKMEGNGLDVRPLAIGTEPRVPADCDLLIIAAPEAPFEPEDRRKVNDYLLSGGRLLAALGPGDTGLEQLLDQWGIRVVSGLVYQRQDQGLHAYWDPSFDTNGFNPRHAITAQFSPEGFLVRISHSRSLELRETGGLQGEYLIRTGARPPTIVDRNQNGKQDEGDDGGPKVLAAAVWRQKPARPLPDTRFVDTRLVVLGESAPLLNQLFNQYTHREFLQNCASWLVGREEGVAGESSSAWTERRLKSSPAIEEFLFWVPIFLFPGIAVCLGSFIYFLRRS